MLLETLRDECGLSQSDIANIPQLAYSRDAYYLKVEWRTQNIYKQHGNGFG